MVPLTAKRPEAVRIQSLPTVSAYDRDRGNQTLDSFILGLTYY